MTSASVDSQVNITPLLKALGHFQEVSEGAIAVDRDGRITWINDKYVDLLRSEGEEPKIGSQIETHIPNSKLPEVAQTGEAILLDIMKLGSRRFVVCRLPLDDDAGNLIGAVGFVFFGDVGELAPLVKKLSELESEVEAGRRELARMRRARFYLSSYVGTSKSVQTLRQRARLIAKRESPVLISGETGVGKELLAHGIHLASNRAAGPFVAINVASIPEERMEVEFFGQVETDSSGRETVQPGKFAMTDGGTLLLDEIGNMPLAIQAKLLRSLEDGVIEPVGSREVGSASVRIIATTSMNLEKMVADGRFREDLYYRLAVLPIVVPPLRTRVEDLESLVDMVLDSLADDSGSPSVSEEAMQMLRSHTWPGNVRELKNVLERACLETDGEVIGAREIALALQSPVTGAVSGADPLALPLADTLRRAEKMALVDALLRCKGNRDEAALLLGISRSSLYNKLKSLGVEDI
ncbi:MAG: sigma 54-interacting transcriptional regulator [Roseibium sp.]|uniref:sigma-54 interaction domain-containing protein n=1 Tax=Roseibium sp. TaxID=1936156 RepID=UPI001B207199|nr:sigma 54-interacting transcriptional regulator [Roseibium sp.]MBO6892678.1 sigma 54-interacting transcriptional regulator [Roseibium sp.]MBO6928917.1 sigma 54-interacting transcriptional regulator [Roseibium sp.]